MVRLKNTKKIGIILAIMLLINMLTPALQVKAAEAVQAPAVTKQLAVERIYGQNVFETNRLVLDKALEGKEAQKVIMIDANAKVGLSNAIKLSFEQKLPILLADGSDVTVNYLKKLKTKEIVAIGESKAYAALSKNFKVSKVAPAKAVKVKELIKLIPASKSEKLAYIPTGNTNDLLSGINLQSVGSYKVVPRLKIDPMEINKYLNLVIVGNKDALDFTTRVVLDPKKAHKWQDAAWMLYNNQLLDCLYETNPVIKEGDVYKVIYTDKPFKLVIPKNYNEQKAVEAFNYRFLNNFNCAVKIQFKEQKTENLSTFDTKTKIFTPKFLVRYTEKQLQIRREVNNIAKRWVVENISKDLTVKQKAEKAFNYVVDNTEYSSEDTVDNNGMVYNEADMVSALIMRKGNCTSKSKVFSILAKTSNVMNYMEIGTNGGYHTWNLIKDNENIYAIDTTFANSDKANRYKYFYRTQKEFGAMGYKKK